MRIFNSLIVVRQHDQTDCAAACLATVAKTYGLTIPLAKIRQFAGTDQTGTTVLGLAQAARRFGFEAKPAKAELEALRGILLPAIAHVNMEGMQHFVVIHRIDAREVVIADPAVGLRRLSIDAFKAIWTSVVILLVPESSFKPGEQSEPTWKRFLRLLEPHDFLLAECLLVSLAVILVGLAFSLYLQFLVDRVVPTKDWIALRWMSLGLAGAVVARAILNQMRSILMAHLSQKIDVSIMYGYLRQAFRLPMNFFETRHVGEIIRRFADGVKIREALSGSTLILLVDTTTAFALFGVLCFYSLRSALIVAAVLPLLAWLTHLFNRRLKKHQRRAMEAAADLESNLVENLGGIATLKALNAEDAAIHKAETLISRMLGAIFNTVLWAASTSVLSELILSLGTVAVLWYTGGQAIRDGMSLGEVIAFYTVLMAVFQPILRLVNVNQSLQDAIVAADRLCEVLDLEVESQGGPIALQLSQNMMGGIRFEKVTFGYPGRPPLFKELSFEVPARTILGITGESGSGKSTLAKLLLRHYDPSNGAIRMDEIDLRDLRLSSIRDRVGLVDQDSVLFRGSIYENLTLGSTLISPAQILKVVKEVGLDLFIQQLPLRFDTPVGSRGMALSGGQRQRLVIARTLLRDPRILVLDEPTSGLDALSEQEVLRAIERLRGERTLVIIAHRLSTLTTADQILFMDKGTVIEQGTHKELIEVNGRYAELWKASLSIPCGPVGI